MAEQCSPPWPGEPHPGATSLSPVCGREREGSLIYLFIFNALCPKTRISDSFPTNQRLTELLWALGPRKRLVRGGANGFKTRQCALICERYWTPSRRPRRESPGTHGDSRFDHFRCLSASFLLISSRRQTRLYWGASGPDPTHVCAKQACA